MTSSEQAMHSPTVAPSTLLSVAASTEQLLPLRALVRTAAAHYAVSVDSLTDLVLAVDEAATTLIGHALPHSALTCTFDLDGVANLHLKVTVNAASSVNVSSTSFGWIVLKTLVDDVVLEQVPAAEEGAWTVTIILTKALPAGS